MQVAHRSLRSRTVAVARPALKSATSSIRTPRSALSYDSTRLYPVHPTAVKMSYDRPYVQAHTPAGYEFPSHRAYTSIPDGGLPCCLWASSDERTNVIGRVKHMSERSGTTRTPSMRIMYSIPAFLLCCTQLTGLSLSDYILYAHSIS